MKLTQKDINPFPHTDSNKRYHTYDYYLRTQFGGKVAKITLDAGFTCPDIETVKKIVARFPKVTIHYDGYVDEAALQQINALLQKNHLIIWLPFDNDITAWCKFPKANKEMCDMAHKYGEVGVWILHEEADRQAAEAMGADIIETTGSLKP